MVLMPVARQQHRNVAAKDVAVCSSVEANADQECCRGGEHTALTIPGAVLPILQKLASGGERDLAASARVSRAWREASCSNALWLQALQALAGMGPGDTRACDLISASRCAMHTSTFRSPLFEMLGCINICGAGQLDSQALFAACRQVEQVKRLHGLHRLQQAAPSPLPGSSGYYMAYNPASGTLLSFDHVHQTLSFQAMDSSTQAPAGQSFNIELLAPRSEVRCTA